MICALLGLGSSRPEVIPSVFWKKFSQFEFHAFLVNYVGKQVSSEV